MNEKELIILAQKDKEALNTLLTNHHPMVYGFLLQLTHNQELAKDITQETMIKAIINLKRFKFKSKFSTWLIAIAINTHKNYLKKNKTIYTTYDDNYVSDFNLEKCVMTKDDFKRVMEALSQMKDSQKMPFLLKHYYGFSYEEIAVIMKCPIGTVRSRIHNTIKKLQKSLGGLDEM